MNAFRLNLGSAGEIPASSELWNCRYGSQHSQAIELSIDHESLAVFPSSSCHRSEFSLEIFRNAFRLTLGSGGEISASSEP